MRTLIALTLAALSLSASVAAAAPVKAPVPCPASLPFPVPSHRVTAEWTDTEWSDWADTAVGAFCAGRESSHACRCARYAVDSAI